MLCFFFYIIRPHLTLGNQDGFLMEKEAEISCDCIRNTFPGVQQTKDKGLLLGIVSIFVKIAAI